MKNCSAISRMWRWAAVSFCALFSVFTLTACSAPLKVTKLADAPSLSGQPKRLALMTGTAYDADIRLSLAQFGFKVVKFASIKHLERDTRKTTKELHNKAEIRFGLSVYPGRTVDRCITNSGVHLGRAAFELNDLQTNNTVLFVHAGGWTEVCGLHPGNETVWDKLAQGLAKNFKTSNASKPSTIAKSAKSPAPMPLQPPKPSSKQPVITKPTLASPFCQRRSKNTPFAGVKIHHRGGVNSGHSVQQNPMLRVVPVVHRRAPRCLV